jgi:hypothetical protein
MRETKKKDFYKNREVCLMPKLYTRKEKDKDFEE